MANEFLTLTISQNHWLANVFQVKVSFSAAKVMPASPFLIIDGKPYLPFQLQTEYTSADGSSLLRVITKVKPVTRERRVAERGKLVYLSYYDELLPSHSNVWRCKFQALCEKTHITVCLPRITACLKSVSCVFEISVQLLFGAKD